MSCEVNDENKSKIQIIQLLEIIKVQNIQISFLVQKIFLQQNGFCWQVFSCTVFHN